MAWLSNLNNYITLMTLKSQNLQRYFFPNHNITMNEAPPHPSRVKVGIFLGGSHTHIPHLLPCII